MLAAPAPGSRLPGAGARPPAIAALLDAVIGLGASDLHLTAGEVPVVRLGGLLVRLEAPPVGADELEGFGLPFDVDEVDATIVHEDHRFRLNLFLSEGRRAVSLRSIPARVPTMGDLGLPAAVQRWPEERRGLLLCCGPTGSGKSTTLAAVVRRISELRACHIVTIEDPIEHRHVGGVALVHQRAIGDDTPSFDTALRAVLRQDPDVILVGEMRDPAVVRAALTAAETGHLVLSTVHASDAVGVVNRIIDVFPGDEQPHVRTMLAATLLGVSCQVLAPDVSSPTVRHLVAEVLVATPAVRAAIREGRTTAIAHAVETGVEVGMQCFDRAFALAVADGRVGRAEAEAMTTDRGRMLRVLRELGR